MSYRQINSQGQEAHHGQCCEGKKQFCVLIAACMKEMVARLQQQKPQKISVELNKNNVEKTAEERALELYVQ